MGRPSDSQQLQRFLDELEGQDGGSAGNYAMMELLGWQPDEYWRLREKLLEDGRIVRGRGRGGSVVLVPAEGEASDDDDVTHGGVLNENPSELPAERKLYDPCLSVLRDSWSQEQGLESLHLEITANQGRRKTGGIWTRPDITGVSIRVFKYWPGRVYDLWTFEIKASGSFDVVGIFEAAAHNRYATHSYAMFHVDRDYDSRGEAILRMVSEAQRLGVGLILFTDAEDFSTWDVRVESRRHTPDPALHEEFVSTQLSDLGQEKLLKWSKA